MIMDQYRLKELRGTTYTFIELCEMFNLNKTQTDYLYTAITATVRHSRIDQTNQIRQRFNEWEDKILKINRVEKYPPGIHAWDDIFVRELNKLQEDNDGQ